VSKNTSIENLFCGHNLLTGLDVTKNTELKHLGCSNNELTALNLSNNIMLTHLGCTDNLLTALDVSKNINLSFINCYNNKITNLDVSNNTLLEGLYCTKNHLLELNVAHADLSGTTGYFYVSGYEVYNSGLQCAKNRLTALDTSQNSALRIVDCSTNFLTGLDVSANHALIRLICVYNYIQSADDVIGWRTIPVLNLGSSFRFTPQNSGAPPIGLDVTDDFIDLNFRAAVYETIGKTAPEPIYTDDVFWIEILDVPDRGIQSMAGLEWFVNLEHLHCEHNQLEVLDLSKNTALVSLDCYSNKLTKMNVSAYINFDLIRLYCYDNYLRDPNEFIAWRARGLVINSPGNLNSGTYRFYNQNALPSFRVTGVIKSYCPQYSAIIRLMQDGYVVYGTTTKVGSGYGQVSQPFAFEAVEAGIYTLVVRKTAHTTFTVQMVTVGDEDVDLTQDDREEVRLITLLCGDINGDGEINQLDLNILWDPSNYNRRVDDGALNGCDLNGDGEVNQLDLNILWMPENYNKGAILIE